MPEMDGIAATCALRKQPNLSGIPILAMTATALEEDRVAYIDAGMNSLIAKPIVPAQLFSTLLRWMPARASAPAAADGTHVRLPAGFVPAQLAAIHGLDASAGLARVGGKPAAYLRLLDRFAEHYADGIRDLGVELEAGRLDGARLLAHSLKGASGAVGAVEVMAMASALEAAIVAGEAPPDLMFRAAGLQDQLSTLVAALRAVRVATVSVPSTPKAGEAADRDVVLDHLEGLLAAADFGAGAAVRDASPLLRATLGDGVPALERLVEDYDYPAALAELRVLRGRAAA
jgi:two-component system sensor histidine kinase/response regulator